jgi:hypothetical protein
MFRPPKADILLFSLHVIWRRQQLPENITSIIDKRWIEKDLKKHGSGLLGILSRCLLEELPKNMSRQRFKPSTSRIRVYSIITMRLRSVIRHHFVPGENFCFHSEWKIIYERFVRLCFSWSFFHKRYARFSLSDICEMYLLVYENEYILLLLNFPHFIDLPFVNVRNSTIVQKLDDVRRRSAICRQPLYVSLILCQKSWDKLWNYPIYF